MSCELQAEDPLVEPGSFPAHLTWRVRTFFTEMGLTGPWGQELGRFSWLQRPTKHKNWRGVIQEGIAVDLLPP